MLSNMTFAGDGCWPLLQETGQKFYVRQTVDDISKDRLYVSAGLRRKSCDGQH